MNTELLLRVADHIEAMPESFDLAYWARPAAQDDICDTVACVAGWTVMIADPMVRLAVIKRPERMGGVFPWQETARCYLELTGRQASNLFVSGAWWAHQMHVFGFEAKDGEEFDNPEHIDLEQVPAKAAAAIVRGVAEGLISLDGYWNVD